MSCLLLQRRRRLDDEGGGRRWESCFPCLIELHAPQMQARERNDQDRAQHVVRCVESGLACASHALIVCLMGFWEERQYERCGHCGGCWWVCLLLVGRRS